MKPAAALLLLPLALGCRSAAPSRAGTPAPRMPQELHWVRNSAEYRALVLELYRFATAQVERAAQGREAGSWAVILDADETVLDNSGYEKELFESGAADTPERWAAFVVRQASPAVPGAVAFTRRVRELGGRVAIVSNRAQAQCPDTAGNLDRIGAPQDAVLCRPPESGDKNPRFERVARGEAFPDGRPAEVLLWVGDNIKDFPGLDQGIRKGPEDAYAPFGARFIVLPNPRYGSWEENPRE